MKLKEQTTWYKPVYICHLIDSGGTYDYFFKKEGYEQTYVSEGHLVAQRDLCLPQHAL